MTDLLGIRILDENASLIGEVDLSWESYFESWSVLLNLADDIESEFSFIEIRESKPENSILSECLRRIFNGGSNSKLFPVSKKKTTREANALLSLLGQFFNSEVEFDKHTKDSMIKCVISLINSNQIYSMIMAEYFKWVSRCGDLYRKTLLFSLQIFFKFSILSPIDFFKFMMEDKKDPNRKYALVKNFFAVEFSKKTETAVDRALYFQAYSELTELKIKLDYDVKENRVLVVAPQILGRKHAPTGILISLIEFLKREGREVFVIDTNDALPDVSKYGWLAPSKATDLSAEFSANEVGVPIQNYFKMSVSSFNETVENLSDLIRIIRPGTIWNIAESIALEKLNTPARRIMLPTVAHAQFGRPNYYLIRQGADADRVRSDLSKLKPDIDYVFLRGVLDIKVSPKPLEKVNANSLEACVVGNRLNSELCKEFLSLCDHWCSMGNKIHFYGRLEPKDIEQLGLTNLENSCVFHGYVEELSERLSECDVFLNPDRIGGGYGGRAALYNSIPIVTLPDNDVAAIAGEDFIVKDWNEYLAVLKKLNDFSFYKLMRNLAERRVKYLEGSSLTLSQIVESL